jgi:hypothetical protein
MAEAQEARSSGRAGAIGACYRADALRTGGEASARCARLVFHKLQCASPSRI